MNRKQKTLLAVFLVLLGLASFVAYRQIFGPWCSTEDNIKICISVDNRNISTGESVTVSTVISNTAGTPLEYSVAVGSSSYSIRINDESRISQAQQDNSPSMGLPAFSSQELSGNDERNFTTVIHSDELVNGENTIQSRWMGSQLHASPKVTITLD